MDKTGKASNKTNGRFIILIIMLLIITAITAWAAIKSVSGINNNTTGMPVTDNINNTGTAPVSTPLSTDAATKTPGQVDMDKLGKEILSKVQFETELKELDKTVAEGLIEISGGSKLQLYMGNGNYSDELILITASNKENAEKDQEAVTQYLKDMRKSFSAYIPEQAKKISDAFNMRSGCYVVVCVTSDIDTAKEIILAAFE